MIGSTAERRNGAVQTRVNATWPDMSGLAMNRRSHRLYLRDDPQRRRRQTLDIHLSRRRERHVRLSRAPQLGFWQQPVGGVISLVLVLALIGAMYVTLFVVGGGMGAVR